MVQKSTAAIEEIKGDDSPPYGVDCGIQVGEAQFTSNQPTHEACTAFQQNLASIGREMGLETRATSNNPTAAPPEHNPRGPR